MSPSTPPLELVKLINFAGGYCSVGPHCVEEHESNAEIVMMHTDVSRAHVHAPSKANWEYIKLTAATLCGRAAQRSQGNEIPQCFTL